MDFSWSEETDQLYQQTVEFAASLTCDGFDAREAGHELDRGGWEKCGSYGLLGLSISEQYGGLGLSPLVTARMMEAFGRGCHDLGLAFAAGAHLFACAVPIQEFAGDDLKGQFLRRMASGELIAANAISEPEAGSDVFAMKTRIRRDGECFVVNGVKSWVSNAPDAHVFLVFGATNPDAGYFGITALLVDRDTPGLEIGKAVPKIGLRTAPFASVYLQDCRVPVSRIVGSEGGGAPAFRFSMGWERIGIIAMYIGRMERQIEAVLAHVKDRKQFGKRLADFQALSHRIADMKVRLEASRLLVYRAAWALETTPSDAEHHVAIAKLATAEAAVGVALESIQLHGAMGVTSETELERGLRDAVPARIYSGTSEIQRELICRALGL